MFRILLSFIIIVLLTGCLALSSSRPLRLNDVLIETDTVWNGSIVIDGSVRVSKGATLTILPGTEISFVRRDKDADGFGDGTIIIEGQIIAIGNPSEPIIFRSAESNPRPGDWLEIRADFAKKALFRYCEFRESAYTLHAHFTKGRIENCTIRYNVDGCRLGESQFIIRNNLFEKNDGKAINFRNSTVEITHNIIRNNDTGIFIFETNRSLKIEDNNIYDNINNVRLGDFFTGDVRLQSNWWGSTDSKEIREYVYDSRIDPEIGTVYLTPAMQGIKPSGPQAASGIQETDHLKPAKSPKTW